MKIGDYAKVKTGVKDVDFDVDLSGWQGQVIEIHDTGNIEIAWDSLTLRAMPPTMIAECEDRGYGWDTYVFAPQDLESVSARDTQADVKQALAELEKQHAWDWLGKEADLTREILAGLDLDNDPELFAAWNSYMQARMTFPFDAIVDEAQERGPLHAGDRVRVHRIMGANNFYGVIVRIQRGRRQYDFPLCDLEALDEASENYTIIRNYRVWFANR